MRKSIAIVGLAGMVACADGQQGSEIMEEEVEMADAAADGGAPEVDVGPAPELTSVRVGELTFEARVAGPDDGEPVILLHGFPQTSREWTAQIAFLADAGYRVVAPDQRGYSPGARPSALSDYKTILLVQDVVGLADALGFERFHLVGHDWGAGVAWVTAALAPQRLLSLVAMSVPHPDAFYTVLGDPTSCQPAASAYIQTLVADDAEATILRDDAALLRMMYQGLPRHQVDFYLDYFRDQAALRAALNWYRANLVPGTKPPSIGRVNVPTLYIWSDEDTAVCRDGAELTREYVGEDYRFEVLTGVNHWVPELAADRVNQLLLEQLAAHPFGE